MTALIFCRRPAETDVTVTQSDTHRPMDWLCWWFNHVVHVVYSSTAMVSLTNMTEKCKSK